MKRTLQFVPTYITVFLIIGIISGYYFFFHPILIFVFLVVAVIALLILYFRASRHSKYNIYFGFGLIILSFIIGISTITFNN
ncbi:MAG: hypothetical protein Q8S44_01975, partial [Flavobacteriaceae bacterium]|nr:hypothetical protein [Flavobacteriaceae bacterium]